MIKDLNKGIENIQYNHLNLPEDIEISSDGTKHIYYTYDATGIKLSKQVGTKITDYVGNFIYDESDNIKYIITNYGRLTPLTGGAGFSRHYNLTDHLGNTRITFNDQNQVEQDDAYYPFGMSIAGLSESTLADDKKNKYLYNGKELQEEFGLDWYSFEFRNYDPQLGRFHVIDPMIEKHYEYSGYAYVYNNPINLVDPFGLDTTFADNNAKVAFDNTYSQTEAGIERLNKKKDKIKSKLEAKTTSKKLIRKYRRTSNKLHALNEVKGVLDNAITSSMEYHFISLPSNEFVLSGGTSNMNFTENRYEIRFVNGSSAGETVSHESTHGLQYETGSLGLIENFNTGKGDLVDYSYRHELEAFTIGKSFTKYTKKHSTRINQKRLMKMIIKKYKDRNITNHSF